jgi:hypothetical protein
VLEVEFPVLAAGIVLPGRARAQEAICGDGVVDAGEACDEGVANGTPDSCCTATCTLRAADETCRATAGACDVAETCNGVTPTCPPDGGLPDGDGDGICDAIDRCPEQADPDQADDDGDGLGNACDPCTDVVPTTVTKAVLKISKLLTPLGDDRLKFKATVSGVPLAPALDLSATGMRIILSDALSAGLIDARLPGGAYSPSIKAGWKGGGTGWSYANGGQLLPLIQGITKAAVKGRASHPGTFTVSVTGKKGSYGVTQAGLPVVMTVVFTPPFAATGQCAEADFTNVPGCVLATNGSLLCK